LQSKQPENQDDFGERQESAEAGSFNHGRIGSGGRVGKTGKLKIPIIPPHQTTHNCQGNRS
jgi:hypothetical protein